MYEYEETEGPEAEFTVIQSECGSWLLMIKPERDINYSQFLDGVRTFLWRETGMDDSRPESEKDIN